MNLTEYANYDGLGLAELVRTRQINARELARVFQQAVDRVNPLINAVIETYPERIAALDPDHVPNGPVAGVPFLMKDVGSGEAGKHQELGSRLTRGRIAPADRFLTQLPLFNLTGHPAISLPLGMSTSGLPIGVQFVARFGREDLLLRLASTFEQAVPWRERRPMIHVSADRG